ncbi:MAG: EVE domain-containing protein [Planctomycetota bacterium]|jgi:predicted RNA-binding protein with PUA-like domain
MATKKARAGGKRRYWLFKSEPGAYSIDDLVRDKRTCWDGVRNYEARNLLRDDVKIGDGVLFYHSNARPMAVTGVAEVVREGYPDYTAFDPGSKYHDPKSDPEKPAWFMVDIRLLAKIEEPVTREVMMGEAALKDMMLLRRGARLSIQPVSKREWDRVLKMAGLKLG